MSYKRVRAHHERLRKLYRRQHETSPVRGRTLGRPRLPARGPRHAIRQSPATRTRRAAYDLSRTPRLCWRRPTRAAEYPGQEQPEAGGVKRETRKVETESVKDLLKRLATTPAQQRSHVIVRGERVVLKNCAVCTVQRWGDGYLVGEDADTYWVAHRHLNAVMRFDKARVEVAA